ncbi:hypothetical protein [Sulfitobacter delicatus]|uniref:DUF3987 domain-containing protein n=1 Tax=Sulfitobacter delicatus TaxID=218672 RepID=A0A1G7U766_9RHOB|nr:hypothetical protein [Sulfitobacter delicatus]SDG43264.1 hypothetical protein SAMN04489759_107181 [Sulfitobacter delicatus]
MTKKIRKPTTPEHVVLSEMRVRKGRGSRLLTQAEIRELVQMFAAKLPEQDFDVLALAPEGSLLKMVARHFQKTDISYALPIMHTIMLAASRLTQSGAYLEVPGIGRIMATLWSICLAESGSAKTLASDEITKIFSYGGASPVKMLPDAGSDAQWILEIDEHNGSFWFQDEVGKRVNAILTQKHWARLKPWMLNAYSYEDISNRLKGEKLKLTVENPHFTFLGLSVFSTWKNDIDASSMFDGFCQRFNYIIADKRTDTSMYDHFLYFTYEGVDDSRTRLKNTWDALCHQPNAFGAYSLGPDVIPYLENWWSELRSTIGRSGLPDSFVRRIGFSIMRYLLVLQFLLGKSRHPIDLETTILATKFAEFHMQSALRIIQDYNQVGTGQVQRIVEIHDVLKVQDQAPTPRNISRKLSKAQRIDLPTALIRQIVSVLDKLESQQNLFDINDESKVKSAAMVYRHGQIIERLKLNERKRNERRLRVLREALDRDRSQHPVDLMTDHDDAENVVLLGGRRGDDETDLFDLTG